MKKKILNKKKKAFTCLVKHFRSNPLTAMLRSRLSRFSQTKFRNKVAYSYGFTLAETLITLTILGIVAAITIPGLINRQQEAANRTKVKKAMATYEKALNQMVIDYDIKSDLALGNEFPLNDCSKTSEYFKIAEGSDCRFKTSDGIWWDISNIKKPVIILDKKFKDADWSDLRDGYAETLDGTYIYGMTGRIDDNGILRINDKKFEDNDENQPNNQKCLAKLYSFVNNTEDLDLKYANACPNECNIMGLLSGGSSGCSSCSTDFNFNDNDYKVMFDENGNLYKAISRRMYWEPDISEEIIINSDMTISDKLFYENGKVAVDITCDFNDAGKCNLDLASYDDVSRPVDGYYPYTEYFDAVTPEQFTDSSNPIYGKNIKATSYYQDGKVAFEFEQKSDGTITQTTYGKNKQITSKTEANVKEGKICTIYYDDDGNPSYEGNSCTNT